MSKHSYDDECCYENMTHGVGGQSIPSEYWDEDYRNAFEKALYSGEGFDWIGTGKR